MTDQALVASGPFRTKNEVVSHLEDRILRGEFMVGEKLPSERELCSRYAVSRPVIREALAGLLERGYIDVFAGRGSFVRAVATDELSQSLNRVAARAGITARHLVAARVMLECGGAELAASNASTDDVEAIFVTLQAHERATELAERARTDLLFHEAVALASGNPVIALMFGSIRTQVHSLMLRSHSDQKVRLLGDPMHVKIAEAIREHDPVRARTAMTEHIELALTLYGSDLDRPLSEVLSARGLDAGTPLRTG